jgi:sporulation protein YlmC with PRC-barrel domain
LEGDVDLVRDLLDKAVVDRNGRAMGRVDGVVLEPRTGAPPRLAAVLIGPAALGDRLHPRLGRIVRAVERLFGLDAGRPVRIEADSLEVADRRVNVRIAAGDTAVDAVEQRLRRWIGKLPGSR